MALTEYIDNLNQRFTLGNATEHTFRGDLQQLLEKKLPEIRATNEPKRQACGAPDYILTNKGIPIGFIEAKDIARKFIKSGFEVHITTSRLEHMDGLQFSNDDLFAISDEIGTERKHIKFTNYEQKYSFVKNFQFYFDDDQNEIDLINEFPGKCIGFLYTPKSNNQQATSKFLTQK